MPPLPLGSAMEPELSWITYWKQVFFTCFNWILEYYPIQTLAIGVVITVATVIGFRFIGQHAEARNIILASAFWLVACSVIFLLMFVSVGPYLHLQQREKEIKSAAKVEYDAMEKSKNDQIKILNDTVVALQEGQSVLQSAIQALEKDKSSVSHERDRLCEKKVAYKVTPNPLPDKLHNQRIIISKPRTALHKLRIISSAAIHIQLNSGIGSVYSGRETTDYLEPITEIDFPGGITDEYAIDIVSSEHVSIKCIGRVT